MNDKERGKHMVEEMVLEQLMESFPVITGRAITEEAHGEFAQVEGSPDFVFGLDGHALGIELAEIRHAEDAEAYLAEVSQLAWQKHESYERRGLFRNPIALILHSIAIPLFDIQRELAAASSDEFDEVGFVEVWCVDFSDAYYSAQDLRRPADMFCFKPRQWFGFHRIGWWDRKPFG
ncbi:hypothetical protein RA307_12645 [Xanthobacteraceae bacterium Astr-EGSB]|uniref:hypothetical protein n=1 Tax=Astrobacterium formosum TaxID=3069710 RepID=UPI0027ADAF7E|nr:hypothetical protein [Xanthobacteraceae bacterium Astr-EGSB]